MKKLSLGEIMGSKGAESSKKLSMKDIPDILGDRAPNIEYTPVGRLRLVTALRNRFGDGYRNLPGISDVLKEFDDHSKFNVKLQEMKMIKPGKR